MTLLWFSSYIGSDPITIRSAAQPRCAELKDYAALFGGVATSSCAIKRNRNVYVNTLLHYNITQSSLLSSALDHTLTDFELENQLVSTIVSSLTLGGLVDMAFKENSVNMNGLVDNTTTNIDLLKNWKNPQVHRLQEWYKKYGW